MKALTNHQRTIYGILLAISAASFFALSLTTARYTYDYGTNVQSIMLIRFLCMTLIMLIWNKSTSTSLILPSQTILKCAILAVLYYIGIGSYLASVAYMPTSLAVLILYTFPILVILLNSFLEKKTPNGLLVIALIIAFIGLFIALDINNSVGVENDSTNNIQMMGLFFAVSAAFGVTLNMVGSAKLMVNLPFTVFSFYQALIITLISVAIIIFSGDLALPNATKGWYGLFAMLIAFAIAYISVYSALKIIGAVCTSTIMNLEPILTTLFAIALLGEMMTSKKLLGGIIVLAAILLAQWPQIRPLFSKKKTD